MKIKVFGVRMFDFFPGVGVSCLCRIIPREAFDWSRYFGNSEKL